MEKIKIIAIVGPTASGKSHISLELARIFDGEIVSADSMQVYRYMDIGTAKPSRMEREGIPHHLIDIAYPDEDYSAGDFKRDGERAIQDIHLRGKRVFLVGGAGLYVRSIIHGIFEGPQRMPELRDMLEREEKLGARGYLHGLLSEIDPEASSKIHPNNIARIVRAIEVYSLTNRPISEFQKEHGFKETPFHTLKIGLTGERDALYRSIEGRVRRMIAKGLLEEVEGLLKMGYAPSLKSMQGLGYKELADYILGHHTLGDSIEILKKNTRNYAKRQITWFKKDKDIRWFSLDRKKEIVSTIKEFLEEEVKA